MIKVINISSMTVNVLGIKIRPKRMYIFYDLGVNELKQIASLCAVGKIKAYEVPDVDTETKSNNTVQNNNPTEEELEVIRVNSSDSGNITRTVRNNTQSNGGNTVATVQNAITTVEQENTIESEGTVTNDEESTEQTPKTTRTTRKK